MNTQTLSFGALLATLAAGHAQAQAVNTPPSPLAESQLTWQQCQALGNNKDARLACFDRWAQQQTLPAAAVPPAPPVLADTQPPPVDASVPATRVVSVATEEGCKDRQYSTLSRFWELETGTDCGTFAFRGYRPLNVSMSVASERPGVPTSPAAGHTGRAIDYQAQEMRIGLSVRTKLAQGLLTQNDPARKDSLWFGYSQVSNWQIFNGSISRPFRTTDHEPELMYVYPTDVRLPGGWRWRYSGLGLVHQSNGQSLPYSRSWNRAYLMAGAELDNRFTVTGRVWYRLPEDASSDDNPDIADFVGRAELTTAWNINRDNTLALTVRNNLRSSGRGSARLEWLKAIGDPLKSNLRFHTQLFYGYGDSLIDYNRKRTVLNIGLSLVDF
ncbi:MAG: phospholipase A [Gammaproteobacteria bacterium]|nr:phospholipase A [Gammaproteobacteria bacterium]MBU1440335.1 phospholipase A [Gammaproteobacteria bacterium]MBU2288637.1 phospholipase A [Gammaproteobacteria bacterium]MBU2410926.1 phospholipase A [Gammaproteobacteria bacterium]